MKYLFTFAAVDYPISEKIIAMAKTKRDKTDEFAIPKNIEQIILNAIKKSSNSIAFYRAVMDGWDATHRTILEWIPKGRPETEKRWKKFCHTGFLICSPCRSDSLGLKKRPTEKEILKMVKHHPLEDYAVRAFVEALYDAIDFVNATRTTLVVTGRIIGGTMDDCEYGKKSI